MTFSSKTSANCLYCHQPAERPIGPEPDKNKAGKCPECASPYHVWCWHVNGGCAKPDCSCNPKQRSHRAIPYLPARVHEIYTIEQGPESAHMNSDRWTAFEKFETAYASQSHRQIVAAWNEELFRHFQPAEKYQADVAVARQCVRIQEQLLAEYRHQHWQAVVSLYELHHAHLDACSDYVTGFKQHVAEARAQIVSQFRQHFKTVLEQNDDDAVAKIISDEAHSAEPTATLHYFEQVQLLTPDERKRAELSLERLAVIRDIRTQLERKDTQAKALALYQEKLIALRLEESKALTRQDRLALYEARRAHTRDTLRQAVIQGDDEQIVAAASAALAAGWTLSDTTRDLVREAGERRAARARVTQARSKQELLIAYDDEVLGNDRQLGKDTRDAIKTSRQSYKPLLALKRAIRRNDFRSVAALLKDSAQTRNLAPHLDDSELAVLARVQEAVQTLHALREALAVQPPTDAALKQVADLTGNRETMQVLGLLMSLFEKEQVRKAQLTVAAVDELRRLEQAPEMAFVKLAIAKTYKKAHAAGVLLPNTLNWHKIRAALEFQERWNVLNRAIEAGDERAIFEAGNPTHLQEALELLDDGAKQVVLKALQSTSRSERLERALASHDEQRLAYVQSELVNPTDASDLL